MSAWGLQFRSGDQTEEGRRAFWATRCTVCPKCQGEKIKEDRVVAGCRMNGDAYGTTVFTCDGCQWFTSFQWDDSGDNYWYETVGWTLLPKPQSNK